MDKPLIKAIEEFLKPLVAYGKFISLHKIWLFFVTFFVAIFTRKILKKSKKIDKGIEEEQKIQNEEEP